MKLFSDQQVDDMVKLRFGKDVKDPGQPTLTTYKAIGKVFGISSCQARKLILSQFEKASRKKLPLVE